MHTFRRVICTTLVFLLVLCCISVGLMELYFRTEQDFFQDAGDRDALAGSLDYLILGASHAYRGFNPEVIDPLLGVHGYNLSGGLMTMRGRYELLQSEVARNPVKTVVLELSYQTMWRSRRSEGPEGDLYVLPRLSSFAARVNYFFTGFYVSEYPAVYYQFVSEGANTLLGLIGGTLQRSYAVRHRGYLPTGPRKIDLPTDYHERFHTKTAGTELDPVNRLYLDKILSLCEEKGIEVIFVTTPLTKVFLSTYANLDYYYDWYRTLAEQRGYRYYDFNLLKEKDRLFPDSTAFFDVLHLNDDGATTLSRTFAELELRAQAGEDISGLFFASYNEMESAPDFFPD